MNDCLTKPFKKKDLLPLLDKWLPAAPCGQSPAAAAGATPAAAGEGDSVTRAARAARSARSAREVFDFPKAVETFLGNEEILRSVLATFVEKGVSQLQLLEIALEHEDLDAVRMEAHSIKGGALNLGAVPLAKAAGGLEAAGKEKRLEDVPARLAELRTAFADFEAVVLKLR